MPGFLSSCTLSLYQEAWKNLFMTKFSERNSTGVRHDTPHRQKNKFAIFILDGGQMIQFFWSNFFLSPSPDKSDIHSEWKEQRRRISLDFFSRTHHHKWNSLRHAHGENPPTNHGQKGWVNGDRKRAGDDTNKKGEYFCFSLHEAGGVVLKAHAKGAARSTRAWSFEVLQRARALEREDRDPGVTDHWLLVLAPWSAWPTVILTGDLRSTLWGSDDGGWFSLLSSWELLTVDVGDEGIIMLYACRFSSRLSKMFWASGCTRSPQVSHSGWAM